MVSDFQYAYACLHVIYKWHFRTIKFLKAIISFINRKILRKDKKNVKKKNDFCIFGFNMENILN